MSLRAIAPPKQPTQTLRLLMAVGQNRLFHAVVEQLLDKGLVDLRTCGQRAGQLPGPLKFYRLAGGVYIRSAGVDRLSLLIVAVTAHRIEVLERESQRIDRAVAHHAGPRVSLQRDPLAGGHLGMNAGFQGRHGFRRRVQYATQQMPREKHAAVDR